MKNLPEPRWLALQFPRLALDLVSRSAPPCPEQPLAIGDGDRRRPRVHDCNPAAMRAGIRPGMPVNAALGIAQGLQLRIRDPHAESAAIERLASWCYRYSSQVILVSGHAALTLEAGASRRLFGSAEKLGQGLDRALLRMGYHPRCGSAPTPEAAQLAARHGLHVLHATDLQRQLGALPLGSLNLDPAQLDALGKTGFNTVGEILRLPRKALARRMGPATVNYLDRLTGAKPDPRSPWQPPEHFAAALDLASGVSGSQALLFPLKRLVSELCGVLRARDRGIQTLEISLSLDHGEHGEQSLRLGLRQATRNEEHILLLLRERLERLELRAPVRRVRIEAGCLLPFDAQQGGLFEDSPDHSAPALGPLLERLQARLGQAAVRGIMGVEDHRPERSWAVREMDEAARCTAMPHRPVWLFARPQRCRIGEYELLAGPERIEGGWWDGHDCRRDYFVVRDRKGSTLWAFRQYKPEPGWYLQGVFA